MLENVRSRLHVKVRVKLFELVSLTALGGFGLGHSDTVQRGISGSNMATELKEKEPVLRTRY